MITKEELIQDVARLDGHWERVREAVTAGRMVEGYEALAELSDQLNGFGFRLASASDESLPIDVMAEDIELQDLIEDFVDGEEGTEDVAP